MADFTPQKFRVPGCVEPEIRQALERIKQAFDAMVDGDTIQITVENAKDAETVGGETPADLHDVEELDGGPPQATAQFLVEATLEADLNSGDTVVLLTGPHAGKTLNGKFIRTDYKLTEGTLVGALPNGTDYSIVPWNICEVHQ